MLKSITFIATALLVIACSGEEGKEPTYPTVDGNKRVEQISRKPFYKANPESRPPIAEVASEEYRLEFAGWGVDEPRFTLNFPEGEYRRVILEYTMGSEGEGPADYDYTTMLFVKDKSNGEWRELARAVTPFGGMFDATWEKHFYLDITEFESLLEGDTEFCYYYGGFDATAERAHSFKLRFLLYEGEPQRELLSIVNLYDSYHNGNSGYRGWAYGVAGHDIEDVARLGHRIVTLPDEAGDMELRLSITGHGHDMGIFPDKADYEPQNMAEFVENSYAFVIDGVKQTAEGRIFYSNADNYPQKGTYNYDRANWAPGNPVNVQYWRVMRNGEGDNTIAFDIDLPRFESSFDAPNAEGVAQYIIQADLFIFKR